LFATKLGNILHARKNMLETPQIQWGGVPYHWHTTRQYLAQFHLSQQGTKPPNTVAGIHTNPELLESTDTKHLDHWKPAKGLYGRGNL
jgi:hypothetical protein